MDREFGPFFAKFSTYFPYHAKRQLMQKRIGFEALDNGVPRCDDPRRLQAICDGFSTQVLDRPVTGRVFFEEVIRENLDSGRPSQVQLVFDRRVSRRTHARSKSTASAPRRFVSATRGNDGCAGFVLPAE